MWNPAHQPFPFSLFLPSLSFHLRSFPRVSNSFSGKQSWAQRSPHLESANPPWHLPFSACLCEVTEPSAPLRSSGLCRGCYSSRRRWGVGVVWRLNEIVQLRLLAQCLALESHLKLVAAVIISTSGWARSSPETVRCGGALAGRAPQPLSESFLTLPSLCESAPPRATTEVRQQPSPQNVQPHDLTYILPSSGFLGLLLGSGLEERRGYMAAPHTFLLSSLKTLIYALPITRIWRKVSLPWHMFKCSSAQGPLVMSTFQTPPVPATPQPTHSKDLSVLSRAGGLIFSHWNGRSSQSPQAAAKPWT